MSSKAQALRSALAEAEEETRAGRERFDELREEKHKVDY